MQIFDEIKNRGVEDVLFICMDGVSGLEGGVRAIFKDVVVQRCIVHLIRNSIKYVPGKDYKAFTAQLKRRCFMEHPVSKPQTPDLSGLRRLGTDTPELICV